MAEDGMLVLLLPADNMMAWDHGGGYKYEYTGYNWRFAFGVLLSLDWRIWRWTFLGWIRIRQVDGWKSCFCWDHLVFSGAFGPLDPDLYGVGSLVHAIGPL